LNDKQETEQNDSNRNNRLDYVLAFFIFIASLVAGTVPSKESPKNDTDKSNEEIAKWTRVVGRWTRLLVAVGVVTLGVFALQLLTFVESERATLVAKKLMFVAGEPNIEVDGLSTVLVLRNVGKHTAVISRFKATAGIFVVNKELAKFPQYKHDVTGLYVVPPMLPDDDRIVFMREKAEGIHNETDQPIKPRGDIVAGFIDGSIPFRVWGLIEYGTGYFSWRSGQLGFCFEYVPKSQRFSPDAFRTCDNPAYTYIR
jgi:hypothetical protein